MEIEQIRIRMGEMVAEIERLQSIVDEKKSVDRDTIINVLLSIGNMSEGIIADAIISAIGAQQSPAVAGPDDEFNHDTDNHHSAMAIDEEQALKDELEWRESDEYKEMEAKLSSQSPRITE